MIKLIRFYWLKYGSKLNYFISKNRYKNLTDEKNKETILLILKNNLKIKIS